MRSRPAPRAWVPERRDAGGQILCDVVIVGAGLSRPVVAFGLRRQGVERVRLIDAAPAGREGPMGDHGAHAHPALAQNAERTGPSACRASPIVPGTRRFTASKAGRRSTRSIAPTDGLICAVSRCSRSDGGKRHAPSGDYAEGEQSAPSR